MRIRRRPTSVLDLIVGLSLITSVLSPWWIGVPPAHFAQTFGFQSPACWLIVIAVFVALYLDVRAAVFALAVVEGVLIAWFAWAMWVVTTPLFSSLGFPFIGTDLLGPGWHAAAVGLLVASGVVVKQLVVHDVPGGCALWALPATPRYGHPPLGQSGRELIW